jgi:Asp/Glu/hydantoin racemase
VSQERLGLLPTGERRTAAARAADRRRPLNSLTHSLPLLPAKVSDHPLVPLLQKSFGPTGPRVLGMFEAALSAALLLAQASPTGRFAILTTVEGMCPGIDGGVNRFLGVSSAESDGGRYGGSFASSLGVLDLHPPSTESIAADEGERKAIVDRKMRTTAARCWTEGKASVVLLGCAGMSGFEDVVRRGWAEAGGSEDEREAGAVVVDGVEAGVELLAALCRLTATAKAGWA